MFHFVREKRANPDDDLNKKKIKPNACEMYNVTQIVLSIFYEDFQS